MNRRAIYILENLKSWTYSLGVCIRNYYKKESGALDQCSIITDRIIDIVKESGATSSIAMFICDFRLNRRRLDTYHIFHSLATLLINEIEGVK